MLTTQAPNAESAAIQKYRSAEYYRQFDRILAARYVHMQRKKRALAQNAAPGTYVPRYVTKTILINHESVLIFAVCW